MTEKKQIQIGAVLSYLSIALNIVAGLLYTPWMIEKIGQGDYGLYTLSNSLITLFLIDFGLGTATSRYIAKYRAEENQKKIDDFLGAVYKLYLIIDAVIFVALCVVFFFIDNIYVKLTYEEISKFKIVYAISALFAVVNFPFVTFNGILTAYERFIQLKLADIFYRIFLVAFTVLALLVGMGVYALVIVHTFAGLATIGVKFLIVKRQIPVKPNFRFYDAALYKEIFKFSFWATTATLAQRLIFNITPSVLGAVTNSASIAVFGIVTVIEGYAYTITSAINGMFLPKISRIYEGKEDGGNITTLLIGVGKFQYMINGLIIAGFAVVGKSFIVLWMGEEYIDAYYGLLLVMTPGLFFNSLEVANSALFLQNKIHLQAYVGLGVGVVNILLSIPLSARYGAIGACISIFVAYTLRAVALNLVYWKKLKLNIPLFIKQCYVKMGIPIMLTIMLGMQMNLVLPNQNWIILMCKGVLVVITYFILILVMHDVNKKAWLQNMIKQGNRYTER